MCFKSSQMQISNSNKNGFLANSVFRSDKRIGAVGVRDLLENGRQVSASGDK
jgi:hypothetical protein